MAELFERRCVVLVGKQPTPSDYKLDQRRALKLEGLRVTFTVRKDNKPHPNTAEMAVYNLSADSRHSIEGKGQRVVLQAGYRDELAQLFSGDARRIHSEKVGVDWVTKIECGDGERAFAYATVNESYSPGTRIADVVKRTIRALAPDVGNSLMKADSIAGEFSKGYAQHGSAAAELSRLLPPKWSWSLQDGRLELLAPGEVLQESAPLISPDTGLVGSPTWESPTAIKSPARLKVRSLLLGKLRPAQRFQLRSRDFDGVFVAKSVQHRGDTVGGEWFTDIEAQSSN